MKWFWLVLGLFVLFYLFRPKPGRKPDKRPKSAAAIGRPVSGQTDDSDAWEGTFYDVAGPQRSAQKKVRINYLDGNGKATERIVSIRAFESTGSTGLVIGHCQYRNATRTFRFDRMKKVVDEETGEIITDLQKCLNDEWEASPQPVLDELYNEHRDVLKMLFYMAKADGAIRQAELGVITEYCVSVTGDERITAPLIKDMLWCVDAATINTFTRTYNKLRRERPLDAQRAATACRAIVATQKTIHPHEQAALNALAKPLPPLAAGVP